MCSTFSGQSQTGRAAVVAAIEASKPREILGMEVSPDGETRTVKVCAWCLPGKALFDRWPWLSPFVTISHGICRFHQADYISIISNSKTAVAVEN